VRDGTNNVFKAVFARKTPESLAALSHLISAIIGRSLTVEPVRLEFYGAKLFTGQDIRGTDYNELKAAYQIAILAKGRFFDDDSLVHSFEYYDPERHTSLGGRSRIVTLELCQAPISPVRYGQGGRSSVDAAYGEKTAPVTSPAGTGTL
jgi:hypothetical protein